MFPNTANDLVTAWIATCYEMLMQWAISYSLWANSSLFTGWSARDTTPKADRPPAEEEEGIDEPPTENKNLIRNPLQYMYHVS